MQIDLLPSVPEEVNQINEHNHQEISQICAKYLFEFNNGLP